MQRLTKQEYVCFLALAASSRSEDVFNSVGAALLDINGNVLGTGFNGLASGMELPEWMTKEENRPQKSQLMLHAEINLWQRKKEGHEYLLGLTISPCFACAKLIAASKVKQVIYINPYERGDDKFKEVFDFYGIKYAQLDAKGRDRLIERLTFGIQNICC